MNTPDISNKVKRNADPSKAISCHLRKKLDQKKTPQKDRIFQVVYY